MNGPGAPGDRAGRNRAGAERAEPKRAGPDAAGPDGAGREGAGREAAGPDGSGAAQERARATSPDPSPAPTAEDAAFLRRLQQGDEAAFETLYRRLNPALERLCASITGSAALGQDAAQDCWLKVIDRIEEFRGEASLKTWILTIGANRARDMARRAGRVRPVSELTDDAPERALEGAFAPDGRWSTPPALTDRLTAETILGDREALARVLRLIDGFPAGERAALLLRHVEGLSSAETADVLGTTPGNVRVLVHRARERLRAALFTPRTHPRERPKR